MKVLLLHRDQDFNPGPALRDEVFAAILSGNPYAVSAARRDREQRQRRQVSVAPSGQAEILAEDLELTTLWNAMAAGDEFLWEVARRVVLDSLHEPQEILYRQHVLADCLIHASTILGLYELAIEALGAEREIGGLWANASAGYILRRSVRLLAVYLQTLRRMRQVADERWAQFTSEGCTRFFAMLREELSDEYLDTVERYLQELELKRGMLESAELGKGDNGCSYAVHAPPRERGFRELLATLGKRGPEAYSFELDPRDEPGGRYLEELRARGINQIANAVAQAADHVKSFFTMLRLELAFYLGCVNLYGRLAGKDEPVCWPEPVAAGDVSLTARGVYDPCLALRVAQRVVGNDIGADGRSLIVVTGANQGGKSTFVRSLGLAQLMMQSGMFVAAQSFRADLRRDVFTHFKREEDAAMESGKLDEELSRMSQIADRITQGAVIVCNESFASTNEREGSEIARQVVHAMLDRHVKVLFVTHMYDLAHSLHAEHLDTALFLRAERKPDGARTFKLSEDGPLPTSFGRDSYRRIFGPDVGEDDAQTTSARQL